MDRVFLVRRGHLNLRLRMYRWGCLIFFDGRDYSAVLKMGI